MEISNYIGIFIGSSTVVGLFTFVLKKWFEGILNKKLETFKNDLKKQSEIHIHLGKLFIEVQKKLYEELAEISHKSRNNSRDYIYSKYTKKESMNNFRTACHDLENCLYVAKIHIDTCLYDRIHHYKVNNKILCLHLEGDPNLNDDKINELSRESEALYCEIYSELKVNMDSLKALAGMQNI